MKKWRSIESNAVANEKRFNSTSICIGLLFFFFWIIHSNKSLRVGKKKRWLYSMVRISLLLSDQFRKKNPIASPIHLCLTHAHSRWNAYLGVLVCACVCERLREKIK